MKNILHIILISLFSLTVISCAKEDEKKEGPVLTEVYPVTTPTDDPSPNYTFSSTKAGTITYGGSCSSGTTSATSGNNTITFLTLSDGTYIDCTITVTDSAGNVSNTLEITSFTVVPLEDTTAPTASVTAATITTSGNAVVQSTETGTAYLVKTTVTVSNLTSITGAADSQWNSVAIYWADTDTNLLAIGLADGTYKVYAIDAAGNISSASSNSVIVATPE